MTDSDDIKTRQKIGQNLKEIREKRNLTQLELAEQAKINITHYAKIERGETNTRIPTLRVLCRVLKVKSSDILPF
jgi:transcriptional regulator with XRE-family HTH domain